MARRTYLVIAAGSAIGSCVARRLAADGHTLVLAARDRSQIGHLAGDVGGLALQADATSFEDVERCARDAVSLTGRLDGVLNCAGSILLKPAHLTSADEFSQVVTTNPAAQIGLPNHEAIAAAKAGVIGLMRSAAATYASSGIRVNAVAPGLVESPLSRSITSNDVALKASVAMHPLGRIGTPQDIANAVHWLIGPDSAWVTGQVIGVDGGLAGVKGRGRQEMSLGRRGARSQGAGDPQDELPAASVAQTR